MAKNNVEITLGHKTNVIDLSADIDFALKGKPGDQADLADVLIDVVAEKIRNQVKLDASQYNIRLLAVIVEDTDEPVGKSG
jgi:hypothetical protein